MNSYLYGEIIPGVSVGTFKLGWGMTEVLNQISLPCRVKESTFKEQCDIVEGDSIDFFLHPDTKTMSLIR